MSVSRLLLSFVVIALPFGMAPAVAQPADAPATSPKKPSKGEQQALKWFSMLDANQVHWPHLLGHRQITDSYLLGLAVRHKCRFVSFDARLNLQAVPGATAEHLIIL